MKHSAVILVFSVAINLILRVMCHDETNCREESLDCKLNKCTDSDSEKFLDCRLLVLYEDLLLRWDADDYKGYISTLTKYHRTAAGYVKVVGEKNIMIRDRKNEKNISPSMESSYESDIKKTLVQTLLHNGLQDHLSRSQDLVDVHNRRYVKNSDNTYREFLGPEQSSWSEFFTSTLSQAIPTVRRYESTLGENWKSLSMNLFAKTAELTGGTASEVMNTLSGYANSWINSAKKLYSSENDEVTSLIYHW